MITGDTSQTAKNYFNLSFPLPNVLQLYFQ